MFAKSLQRFLSTAIRRHDIRNQIRLEAVNSADCEHMIEFACERFVVDNPIAKALDLRPSDVAPWFERIVPLTLDDGKSIELIDHTHDRLIGVRLNSVATKYETPREEQEDLIELQTDKLSGNAKKLFRAISAARLSCQNHDEYLQKWFRIEFCHMDPLYRGNGLGGMLILGGIDYDKALTDGIQGIEIGSYGNDVIVYDRLGMEVAGDLTLKIGNASARQRTFFLRIREDTN